MNPIFIDDDENEWAWSWLNGVEPVEPKQLDKLGWRHGGEGIRAEQIDLLPIRAQLLYGLVLVRQEVLTGLPRTLPAHTWCHALDWVLRPQTDAFLSIRQDVADLSTTKSSADTLAFRAMEHLGQGVLNCYGPKIAIPKAGGKVVKVRPCAFAVSCAITPLVSRLNLTLPVDAAKIQKQRQELYLKFVSILHRSIDGRCIKHYPGSVRQGFRPEWRTTTALSILEGMLSNWSVEAMPILADALQDAGYPSDWVEWIQSTDHGPLTLCDWPIWQLLDLGVDPVDGNTRESQEAGDHDPE